VSETVERMLPLYEAKMIHQFDHRWATYERDGLVRDVTLEEKQDPDFVAMPRYWVRESVVRDQLDGRWDGASLLGWRRIARSTDERTFISAVLPTHAFGDSIFLMLPMEQPGVIDALEAILASYAFDFVLRQKIGGTNASFFLIEQLPLPGPDALATPPDWETSISWSEWLSRRSVRLRREFGGLRTKLRAELDAATFSLYGVEHGDIDYIMETFLIVKRRDEATYGEYRTKRMVLEIYDQMDEAIRTGTPYESPFDPEEAQ